MKKVPTIKTENIHLLHINVIESSIIDVKHKGMHDFNIDVAHTVMHNLAQQKMKIGVLLEIVHEDSNSNAKAKFIIDFHFNIDEMDEYYELNEKKQPVFHNIIVATLLGICFSTARGMIYERLSHTNMQGLILPVVSPLKMLNNENK